MKALENNDVVIINLDRPRQLWLGHRALKTISALLKKPIAEIDIDHFDPEEIEIIAYGLLLKDAKEHNEDLTLEQMVDLLDFVPLGILIEKIGEAFRAGFGVVEDGEEKNAQGIGTGNQASEFQSKSE